MNHTTRALFASSLLAAAITASPFVSAQDNSTPQQAVASQEVSGDIELTEEQKAIIAKLQDANVDIDTVVNELISEGLAPVDVVTILVKEVPAEAAKVVTATVNASESVADMVEVYNTATTLVDATQLTEAAKAVETNAAAVGVELVIVAAESTSDETAVTESTSDEVASETETAAIQQITLADPTDANAGAVTPSRATAAGAPTVAVTTSDADTPVVDTTTTTPVVENTTTVTPPAPPTSPVVVAAGGTASPDAG